MTAGSRDGRGDGTRVSGHDAAGPHGLHGAVAPRDEDKRRI